MMLCTGTSLQVAAQNFDPPAVRPPTGLTGHACLSKVYLQWNPNLETDLAGYRVYRSHDGNAYQLLDEVSVPVVVYTDTVPDTTGRWLYRIKGVLDNGRESKFSNTLSLQIAPAAPPQVGEGTVGFRIPGHDSIRVENAVTVVFDNGHRIVFDTDRVRLRDWKSADGTHLLYPGPYGNPLDITRMNNWGFTRSEVPTTEKPALPPSYNRDYMTPGTAVYRGHTITGDGITFAYSIPLEDTLRAKVWETFRPVDRKFRDRGSRYGGLSRTVELEMPASYEDGYSVCLNEGFGPGGSCEQGTSYELMWGNPGITIRNWSSAEDITPSNIRNDGGFHPTSATLQARPFIYLNFPQGHLILGARQYYYSTGWKLSNYVEQGKDGIWPNYFTDCDRSGERFTVETYEYLWSPDTELKAPQQYTDASFYYRRYLARLYGLIPTHTTLGYAWKYGGASKIYRDKPLEERLQALREYGVEHAERAETMGADRIGGAHTLWTSGPEAVPEEIRLDTSHPVNRAIRDMTASLAAKGVELGYWIRPEFIRVSHEDIFEESIDPFITTEKIKYGYQYKSTMYPDVPKYMLENGLPLVREHRDTWIRKGRDGRGTGELSTPYDWVPTSLTVHGGLYDALVYPNFVMQSAMGYNSMFFDGGPASLQGIDYTGGVARACQPYWWRLISDIYRLGMDVEGEIGAGFGGAAVYGESFLAESAREHFWGFTHSAMRGTRGPLDDWFNAEDRHTCCQLYVAAYSELDDSQKHGDVVRFYNQFLEKHGHPDGIYLEGLRWEHVKWEWDNVWWEYQDGVRVRYPDYREVMN